MKIKFSFVVPVAPDRNAEVLQSLKKIRYGGYEIITEIGKNPSENRNRGIKKAKGEIIGFIDDDAIVDKDIIKNVENFFKKYQKIDIVGGPQLTPKNDKFFARVCGYAFASYFGTHRMRKRYSKKELDLDADEFSLSSANCFVKKNVFKKIRGFDTRLYPGEDPEFFSRDKKNGFRLAYSPDIIVYHRRRPNLISFFKQFYRYGLTRVKKERISKTKISLVFLLPSILVIYLLFLPLTFIYNFYLIPFYIYTLIAVLNSIYLGIKNKDFLAIFLLPFIFLILHIAYGVGLIRGLLHG